MELWTAEKVPETDEEVRKSLGQSEIEKVMYQLYAVKRLQGMPVLDALTFTLESSLGLHVPNPVTKTECRWISVKDRLPGKQGTYLIFAPSADPDLPLCVTTWWHGDRWGLVEAWGNAVTHWQPLPTPPKDAE